MGLCVGLELEADALTKEKWTKNLQAKMYLITIQSIPKTWKQRQLLSKI